MPVCESAAATLVRLMQHNRFNTDGVEWTAAKRDVGNELKVGDGAGSRATGFSDYNGVIGEDQLSVEQARMQQRNNTLRIKKTTFNKMVRKRNELRRSEGLGVDDLAALEERRPGAAFVMIACVFLIEEMAGGHTLVDLHFVNSASGLAAFGWHIDDHAEAEQSKKYIDRSVACQCSVGDTSMTVAGLPEITYPGVGGFVEFPAWALHTAAAGAAIPAQRCGSVWASLRSRATTPHVRGASSGSSLHMLTTMLRCSLLYYSCIIHMTLIS